MKKFVWLIYDLVAIVIVVVLCATSTKPVSKLYNFQKEIHETLSIPPFQNEYPVIVELGSILYKNWIFQMVYVLQN